MSRAASVLLALLLIGCAAESPAIDPSALQGDATIYVVGRGWHTDIGLPVDELSLPLAALERDFPGVRYLVFGFGEREYIMGRHTGSGEMLAALFPSDSAVLMTALNAPPGTAFPDEHVVTLRVSQRAVDRIAGRIWQTLEKAPDGSVRRLADGPYSGSVFYASTETYDLFYTCNTWTLQVLREAGLPFNPNGVVFVGQVMQQVRGLAQRQ